MFHLGDIDLAHLHHRLHRAAGAVRVGVGDQLEQAGRRHLPGHPPAVLEPAAWAFRAAGRQRRPEPVHFGLVRAGGLERDGFGERELRPVKGDEPGAAECELDGEDCAGARQPASASPGRSASPAVARRRIGPPLRPVRRITNKA
jgi:hypothetical protein